MQKYFSVALAVLLFLGCTKQGTDTGSEGGDKKEEGSDIEVVDGKVKFYVEYSDVTAHSALGVTPRGTKVYVAGTSYSVMKDKSGRSYIEVAESPAGTYSAALVDNASASYYGKTPFADVVLPFSQSYGKTDYLKDYPMYASYNKTDGNCLKFKDGFALIDLCVKGSSSIVSVKLSDPAKNPMAGKMSYSQTKESFVSESGPAFAVLNATNGGNGVALNSEGTHFRIAVVPMDCPSGIDVRLCDASHKMMELNLKPGTLAANQIFATDISYSPDSDLVFYEGFDTFVWGGDYPGGESVPAYAPTAEKPGITYGTSLTGTEDAFVSVSYDTPGTGYIQSNTWDEVTGKTVKTSHQMSEAYLKSRFLWDWVYLFRSQEYQGCIGVGVASTARGIIRTGCMTGIPSISTVSVAFDLCLKSGFDDNMAIQIMEAGFITSARIDGKPVELGSQNCMYRTNASILTINRSLLDIATSAPAAKKWHHIELTVERATSGTSLYLASESSSSGNHGFFVDNIEVRRISDMERGKLRVLYWNIQNGMWADQSNNYNEFVSFVKKYDPDVCVWCESSTIYKDNTSTSCGARGSGFLPNGWTSLAARYGHKYNALGGFRDNYPQEITSKYPITTVQTLTDGTQSGKPISHGAGMFKINVNGEDICFVTLHTWPQAYGYGVSSAGQADSKAKNEGDYYREYEMNCIVAATVNNPAYSSESNWLMMGDFNSRSRLDNWYYKYSEDSTYLLCQDVVLTKTNLVDIIGKRYEGEFIASTGGASRIDYMYASPAMYGKVKNAMILNDNWTLPVKSTYVTSFYDPSDHKPILVDFN